MPAWLHAILIGVAFCPLLRWAWRITGDRPAHAADRLRRRPMGNVGGSKDMSRLGRGSEARRALIVGSLVTAVSGVGPRAFQPKSPAELSPDDRSAISELARKVGIDDPQVVVAYNFMDADDVCPMVKVESRPIVDGRRVISQQLWLRREKGFGCAHWPLPQRPIRHRNWLTSGRSQQVERWRFADGDWHVDVFVGDNLTYENAATIVHAIRNTTLVDRRSRDEIDRRPLSGLDASRVVAIRRADSSTEPKRSYQIAFSSHDWVGVTVVGDVVEIHEWGSWQA